MLQLALSTLAVTATANKLPCLTCGGSNLPIERELLSLRHTRFLPGSKGGGGSSPTTSPSTGSTTKSTASNNKNCIGSWGNYGSCSNSNTQSRVYTITQAKEGTGTSCPKSAGASEFRDCAACVGEWSCWSGCDAATTKKSKTYTISTPAAGSGTACPATDGEIEQMTCTPATKTIDWTYYSDNTNWDKASLNDITPIPIATELPVVHCNVGETVEIAWSKPTSTSTMKHDLWSMNNEEAYVSCGFTEATQLVPKATQCGHVISCTTPGTTYYACNVDGACANGLQRIRIIVTDLDKTLTLRTANAGMKTLANVMEQDLVPVAYALPTDKANKLTDSKADAIQTKLATIATNSPDACADWIIPANLDDATCKAFAYTDMGYLARSRPTPDYTAAETHYDAALALKTNFCPALSYKTELFVSQNDKTKADVAFKLACTECGTNSLDMSDVRLAYGRKAWNVPDNTACTVEVPVRFNADQLKKFAEENAKEEAEKKKKKNPEVKSKEESTPDLLGNDTSTENNALNNGNRVTPMLVLLSALVVVLVV